MREYPVLFVAHGSLEEAVKNPEVERMFRQIREAHIPVKPKAVVVISSQWKNTDITLTADDELSPIDEGFAPDLYLNSYTVKGNLKLCDKICDIFVDNRLTIREKRNRGLDHGALIPMQFMFPEADVPVIQLSLAYKLSPEYHVQVARVLRYLKRGFGILFVASGGIIGNLAEFQADSTEEPDPWVKDFEGEVCDILLKDTPDEHTKKLMRLFYHDLFRKAHPTAEYFMPLVMAAEIGGEVEKIYEGYQQKNYSMLSFRFD